MLDSAPVLTRARERLAVLSLAFGTFVAAVNVNLAGALMPFLAETAIYRDLAAADQKVALGQLVWVTSAAGAVAALLLGPWIDRVGRRRPMLCGGALLAAGAAIHVVAAGHAQLLAARAVSGFGGGLLFTSASAAVADMVPYHRRAAAMGVFTAGMFLAVPVGLPAALALAGGGEDGWRRAFGWLLLPALLALAGIARAVPARLGGGAPRVSQLAVLRAPHVGAALLSVMLYTGAFFTVVQFAPNWLDEDGVLPKSEQGWLWLGIGLATAAGALVLPRLADRVGKRTAVLTTTAGAAICLVLLARVESVLGLVTIGLGMSMLAAARTPSLQALMSEIVEPRQRGTLMGLRAAAINLGAAAFGAFGAAVYASHGFRVLAAAAAAAMAAAYVAVRFGVRVKL